MPPINIGGGAGWGGGVSNSVFNKIIGAYS